MYVSGISAQDRHNSAANILTKNKKVDESQSQQPTINALASSPVAKMVPINFTSIQRTKHPVAIITFGGNKDKNQKVFVGAEMGPYAKEGGVASVMEDYKRLLINSAEHANKTALNPIFLPYYNGKIEYDPVTGDPKEDSKVAVHRLADGTPIYTGEDLTKISIEDVIKAGKYHVLEEVSKKTMSWGLDDQDEIVLYKVKGTNDYMVFVDATAKMPKPYADNSYSFGLKRLSDDVGSWQGSAYAKFDKAFVELLPETGLNPETIVCNDAQSAYIPHYMAQKNLKGDKYYQGVKPTYIEHNVGLGYQGDVSKKQMFVNLAESPEQIRAVKADPAYLKSLETGSSEGYFEKFVEKTLVQRDIDAQGKISGGRAIAMSIPLEYAKIGFVTRIDTVSEAYGKAIAENPLVSPGLTEIHQELRQKGVAGGILNPLSNANIDPNKDLPLALYKRVLGQKSKIDAEALAKLHKDYGQNNIAIEQINGEEHYINTRGFKNFKEAQSLEDVRAIKNENRAELFSRLTKEGQKIPEMSAGLPGKKVSFIGYIDETFVKAAKEGKTNLFVSWGRGDLQKGHDITLDAFKKFVEETGDKNSILVAGGELDPRNGESKNIKMKIKALLNDDRFKGRVVFMDGFAPGVALASAGDASLLPSRFAPCELTDLESMKYFCTPIVAGTQGMDQKNFDPRNLADASRATSYKTKDEFMMSDEKIIAAFDEKNKVHNDANPENKIPNKFKTEYDRLLEVQKKKFHLRGVKDEAKNNELALKALKQSDEYATLRRESADEIMVDQIAEAIKAKSLESKETANTIYKNHRELKVKWDDNAALHTENPENLSSEALYKKHHFDPAPKASTGTLFDTNNTLNGLITNMKNPAARQGPGQSGVTSSQSGFKFSKSGKIGAAVGAVALLAGLGIYLSKSKKTPTNADGDAFQRTSPSRKNTHNKLGSASNKRQKAQIQ